MQTADGTGKLPAFGVEARLAIAWQRAPPLLCRPSARDKHAPHFCESFAMTRTFKTPSRGGSCAWSGPPDDCLSGLEAVRPLSLPGQVEGNHPWRASTDPRL